VCLWDLLHPGLAPVIFKGQEGQAATSIAFSRDGNRLATASVDGKIRVWRLLYPNVPNLFAGHLGKANAVAFSPHGSHLASAGDDGSVRVWIWDSSHPDATWAIFAGHEGFATSVAFSSDGSRLASAGNDTVRLWDLRQPDAPPLVFANRLTQVNSVAFSADGNFLVSGDDTGTVEVSPLWSAAADLLCNRVWRNLSMDEWRLYIGEGIPYQRTCPNLPLGAGAPAQ
jgi:WD40 repeat protein